MIEHVVQEMDPWYYQRGDNHFLPFGFYDDFLLSLVTFYLFLFFSTSLSLYNLLFFLDTCDETGRELLGIRRRMEGQAWGVLKCNRGAIFN